MSGSVRRPTSPTRLPTRAGSGQAVAPYARDEADRDSSSILVAMRDEERWNAKTAPIDDGLPSAAPCVFDEVTPRFDELSELRPRWHGARRRGARSRTRSHRRDQAHARSRRARTRTLRSRGPDHRAAPASRRGPGARRRPRCGRPSVLRDAQDRWLAARGSRAQSHGPRTPRARDLDAGRGRCGRVRTRAGHRLTGTSSRGTFCSARSAKS